MSSESLVQNIIWYCQGLENVYHRIKKGSFQRVPKPSFEISVICEVCHVSLF